MKKTSKLALLIAALTVAVAETANAANDYSAITSAVDGSAVVAAITAVAGIKMLPGVAKWGYNKLIGWFR